MSRFAPPSPMSRVEGIGPSSSGAARCVSLWQLWPHRWAVPGHAPGGQENGQTAHQRAGQNAAGPDAWQGPDGSRAARCVSLGGSVVTYVSNLDTISAPRSASNPHTSADFGHSWPSRWAEPGHGSGRSAGRPAGRQMAVRKATGRMLGRGWAAPGRCAVPPWGGPGRAGRRYWSQLRAVRRTASRPTSGPSRKQRGRMLDRGRATAGGVLRRPGRLWPRGWAAPGPAPGSQQDGQTGRQWVTRGPRAGCRAGAGHLRRGALRRPGRPWPGG